jgi:NAD(P)-dependent dehydrogenase (short-subunit alcohol dehydrogenase family)
LVTGGGTGIGKAIAAALAANGAKVYIAARKESLLKEVLNIFMYMAVDLDRIFAM